MKATCRRWIFLMLSFVPLCALGQSIYGNSVSAGGSAMGGAVVAIPNHPLDIMTSNPAGLGSVDSRELQVGFLAAFAQGHFTNAVNSDGPLSAHAVGVPYAAFVSPLGRSRFKLGLSVTPDSAMTAKWRYLDAPGGIGGTSYGIQENKSSILALRSAIGLGVALLIQNRKLDPKVQDGRGPVSQLPGDSTAVYRRAV
jgi:long-subunit fatty acid transport protein